MNVVIYYKEIDEDGWNVIHCASFSGNTSIIQLLLNRSANINALTKNSLTPLQLSCLKGHIPATKLLLAANARINVTAKRSWTALHLAATNGHVDCLEILIHAKANINACRPPLGTALHVATHSGFHHVVAVLLANQANPYILNDLHQNPLQVSEFPNISRRLEETMEQYPPSYYSSLPPIRRLAPVRKVSTPNPIRTSPINVSVAKSQPIKRKRKKVVKIDSFQYPPPSCIAPPPPTINEFNYPPPTEIAPAPPNELGKYEHENTLIGSYTIHITKDKNTLKKFFMRRSLFMDPQLYINTLQSNISGNSTDVEEDDDDDDADSDSEELTESQLLMRDCSEQTDWFIVAMQRHSEKVIINFYETL